MAEVNVVASDATARGEVAVFRRRRDSRPTAGLDRRSPVPFRSGRSLQLIVACGSGRPSQRRREGAEAFRGVARKDGDGLGSRMVTVVVPFLASENRRRYRPPCWVDKATPPRVGPPKGRLQRCLQSPWKGVRDIGTPRCLDLWPDAGTGIGLRRNRTASFGSRRALHRQTPPACGEKPTVGGKQVIEHLAPRRRCGAVNAPRWGIDVDPERDRLFVAAGPEMPSRRPSRPFTGTGPSFELHAPATSMWRDRGMLL